MGSTDDIKHRAIELGFDPVGVTDASPIHAEQAKLIADWLKASFAGQMDYMHRNFEKRTDPSRLLENAQSVIVLGLNYKPAGRSASLRASPSGGRQSQIHDPTAPTGRIANYAQYEDYHSFIKKRLRRLIDFISSIASTGHEFKICVDSAPLAERALAARAGLGFIGRNHMLINPKLGPQIFLGEIITTLNLQPDEPIFCHSERSEEFLEQTTAGCSNCTKCLDACPTGALRPDSRFDANKCVSYLTIEHKGHIASDLARKIGDRLFGCDECVLACPYQQNAPVCKNKEFRFYPDRAVLDLRRILNLTLDEFGFEFADSPIRHLGFEGLERNAQICLANVDRLHLMP